METWTSYIGPGLVGYLRSILVYKIIWGMMAQTVSSTNNMIMVLYSHVPQGPGLLTRQGEKYRLASQGNEAPMVVALQGNVVRRRNG